MMLKEVAATTLVVLICSQEAYGHGFMWYPWSWNPCTQPGMAPVFGQGCGANGGNPDGCHGCGLDGIFYGGCNADTVETNPYGTCCTKAQSGIGCGGYVGGKSALEHYDEGHFLNTPTTNWKVGNVYPVY